MKKRILFAAMGLALSAGCFAQSASDVIIKTTSGDKTYKISEVKNLRIEGNTLKVNKKTGEAADTYNFDEIKSIMFALSTGIDNARLPESNLTISSPAGSNMIYVKGNEPGKRYDVAIYDAAGKCVMRDANWQGAPINVANLSKGVFVFKINKTAIKFSK